MPGRLRSEERSARFSLSRRKIRSSVSLRVTMTSMVERASWASSSGAALASCRPEAAGLTCSGPAAVEALSLPLAPAVAGAASGATAASGLAGTRAGGPGGTMLIPPCRSDQATMAQALACSHNRAENRRRRRVSTVSLKSNGIDNCYGNDLQGRTLPEARALRQRMLSNELRPRRIGRLGYKPNGSRFGTPVTRIT